MFRNTPILSICTHMLIEFVLSMNKIEQDQGDFAEEIDMCEEIIQHKLKDRVEVEEQIEPQQISDSMNKKSGHIGQQIECSEVEVLTEAINLLSTILVSTESCGSQDARLDELQSRWKLEDTGFIRLYNSCMQLKQTLHLTASEAELAVIDVHETNKKIQNERLKRNKLSTALKKMCKENHALRDQNNELAVELHSYKEEKKSTLRSLRKYVRSWRKERNEMKNEIVALSEYTLKSGQKIKSLESNISSETDGTDSICTTTTSASYVTDDGCRSLRLVSKAEQMRSEEAANTQKSRDDTYEIVFKTRSPGLQFLTFERQQKENDNNANSNEFLVCGFNGFCDNLHKRPSFGARLIGIDGKSEEILKSWTLSGLSSYVSKKQGLIKWSFRDDPISPQRLEALNLRANQLMSRR